MYHRDERASKTHERLQKRLKERCQAGGGGSLAPNKDSPPLSPLKNSGILPAAGGDLQNGLFKGVEDQSRAASLTNLGKEGPGRGMESPGMEFSSTCLRSPRAAVSVICQPILEDVSHFTRLPFTQMIVSCMYRINYHA